MTLGPGVYTAYLQERGGGHPLAELPWSDLRFGRRLDDMSEAALTVPVAAAAADSRCCAALESLKAWKHEISIWRDAEEAWVGVVGRPRFTNQEVSIPARDLFMWMERRVLPTSRSYVETDLGIIFGQYVTDALAADTSPNILQLGPVATGVFGTREVVAAECRRAADELREMGRSGVDWTLVGRTLYVGGEEVPLLKQLTLTTECFDEPVIESDGLAAASESIVIGAAGDDQHAPIVGRYGDIDPDIGVVQVVDQESGIKDDESALAAARSRWEMLHTVPEFVSGVLVPQAPVRFSELIPGARVDLRVRTGCRSAIGVWRLHSVDVNAQVPDDGAVDATVAVTLIPEGTTE